MIQLNKEQAIAYAESREWEKLDDRTLALFQLDQKLLCVPFDRFHQAVERSCGRPVYSHELGLYRDELFSEILGDRPAPSLDEIMSLLPANKTIVAVTK